MTKKTIIAVYGRQGEGKSSTVKNVCRTLLANYPNANLDPKYELTYVGDILVVIQFGNLKIGIESQGDPNSRMFWGNSLEKLAGVEKCDIILCTSRTSGGTVGKIDEIANKYTFEVIWLSSLNGGNFNHDVLNNMCADFIIRLFEALIVGRL